MLCPTRFPFILIKQYIRIMQRNEFVIFYALIECILPIANELLACDEGEKRLPRYALFFYSLATFYQLFFEISLEKIKSLVVRLLSDMPTMPLPCSSADEEQKSRQPFLLLFSQAHPQFRRAEFESVCRICGVQEAPAFSPPESHLQLLELPGGESAVRAILRRSILLKSAFQFLHKANSHESLLEQVKARTELFQPFNRPDQSWCLQVRPQARKRPIQQIQSLIQLYGNALDLSEAPIDLANADNTFAIFELFKKGGGEEPAEVLLARFIGEGQTRLKVDYALPNRRYIGNSTMDPELAFIQANLVLARPGTLAMDPFCGTGGLLLPAAHFGAHVLGVEIKWDVAKAKGKSSRAGQLWLDEEQSVRDNFAQYKLDDGRFLGILLADSSQHGMWRSSALTGSGQEERVDGSMDAILADPPYGIRERGRKLGTDSWKHKKEKDEWNGAGGGGDDEQDTQSRGGRSQQQKHYPEKQQYEMSSVFLDLLDLAARMLRIDGRLAFWFPICRSEYSQRILPRSDCMRLVYNCEQPLAKDTSRLLLVYEKARHPRFSDGQLTEKAYFEENCYGSETFRQKIFTNAKKEAA